MIVFRCDDVTSTDRGEGLPGDQQKLKNELETLRKMKDSIPIFLVGNPFFRFFILMTSSFKGIKSGICDWNRRARKNDSD